MVAKSTVSRDTQIEDLVLEVCTQTKVNLWQTTTQNRLVVGINLTVAIYIAIVAITYMGTWLILFQTLSLCKCVQLIELLLGTDNTLVIPTIELTNFLTNLGDIRTSDILLCTETKRCNLILQGAQVSTDFVLQSVIAITIGE